MKAILLTLGTAAAMTAAVVATALPASAQNRVTGSGNVTSESRTVGRFNGVRIGGAFKVVLTKGSTSALKIEAEDNILPKIETYVEGGTLVIKLRDNWSFNTRGPMRAYITFTDLQSLDISGAVTATCEGTIEADRFTLDASGASNINLPFKVRELNTDVSGASKITLTGSAERFSLDASGATSLYAFGLSTGRSRLDLSGASKAEISVNEELNVDASGASKVTFRGSPRIQTIDASGASKVRKEAE